VKYIWSHERELLERALHEALDEAMERSCTMEESFMVIPKVLFAMEMDGLAASRQPSCIKYYSSTQSPLWSFW